MKPKIAKALRVVAWVYLPLGILAGLFLIREVAIFVGSFSVNSGAGVGIFPFHSSNLLTMDGIQSLLGLFAILFLFSLPTFILLWIANLVASKDNLE